VTSLSTEQLNWIARYVAPLMPAARDRFIEAVIERLKVMGEVGPGTVHRVAREVQARYVVSAAGLGPRHKP